MLMGVRQNVPREAYYDPYIHDRIEQCERYVGRGN